MHLIPVCNELSLREHGIFFKPSTLRKWHCQGAQPQLFRKFRKRLFVDLVEWQKLIEGETENKN
jgi:hypothetical protein